MVDDTMIARINALAKKAKTAQGLTQAEEREREALRRAYLSAIRENLTAQLDRVYFVDDSGQKQKLKKRRDNDGQK